MIYFCIQSALREYGWRFFRHIAIKHPVKTLRAFFSADKIDTDADIITICGSREKSVIKIQGEGSIVGVGFCMKPIEPLCPSGRFNHDCLYLESILPTGANEMPDCCRGCYIRMLGLMTLKTGAAYYIMTSAKDILFNLYKPALNNGRFRNGLFILCKYSLKPFAVGMLASGIDGHMLAFDKGDCVDYATWLRADNGNKDDRTSVSPNSLSMLKNTLAENLTESLIFTKFRREGNILYPVRGGINPK